MIRYVVITEGECRVLLALAQFQPDTVQRGRIASIYAAGGVNWHFLSATVRYHGAASLEFCVTRDKIERGLQNLNFRTFPERNCV